MANECDVSQDSQSRDGHHVRRGPNKGAGNGQKKADLVIELTPALISAVEATIDKDLLNQAKVQEAERAFFTATINFAKAIDAAKHAKGTGGTPQ